ncbi:hypothetical protein MN086_06375 [Sulfurovum sp. XGS-02]|uniref:hypothetical protein n=1 Tax=Sulfurovum sp. XGS-02 TaxID=2925411 RepID=UPI00204D915D|nr:hypothetical protein [Sulfurovum sp. XGS-02]UPT76678.1 hypothetical protein MN086_06375 [Sulfurovum sp. XGS-02]
MVQLKYTISQLEKYYDVISQTKPKSFNGKTFEQYYQDNWESKIKYPLKDVICGDIEKLIEIKKSAGSKYKNNRKIKELFNYDKTKSKNIKPLLSKLQPKIASFFENNIEIHTCYFCNIDFINVFNTKSKRKKNGFTLDHLIDKATYPLFALSIYNLIPSCYICNSKLKGSKEIWTQEKGIVKVSPSAKNFKFDQQVKFKTFMKPPSIQINDKIDFDLLLKEDFTDDYTQYIDVFELNGRYEYFKPYILNMIKKRRIYPDSRIKEIALLTRQPIEKVKQDLFGEVLYEDDNSKHSLAKLTKDIANELSLYSGFQK